MKPNKAVNRSGGWRVFCLPAVLAAARLPWTTMKSWVWEVAVATFFVGFWLVT